jgi:histidyl-tRNA synthetase
VAGGGRYDGLIGALGGPEIPAIGFAIGFDRLAEIVATTSPAAVRAPRLFIAALGEPARARAFQWVAALGTAGIGVAMEYGEKSLKAQMKQANRQGADSVLIVGESELQTGKAVLRNMADKSQREVPMDGLVETLIQTLH